MPPADGTAWPEEKVLEHIRQGAGSHFDPAAVEAFMVLVSAADAEPFPRAA